MINKKQFSQKTIKRSILFVLFFFAFFTSRINAQGVDAVFFLDNSSSIDNTEWTDMSSSTKALIDDVLGCNINNRIAVAHFAGFYTDPNALSTDPRIFLDKNFTNNATTAKSFVRRGGIASQGGTHYATLGNETWLHENIALLQNSLGSSTASSQIVSTLKKLSRNPNNKLVIFIFTDAPATGNGLTKASFSSGGAFENYNIIKTSLGATIVIIQAPTGNGATADANSRAAAAAIASVGGSYNGTVQANAGDPQGSGTKPRKAVMSNVFDISNIDIEIIADNICKSCAPTVAINAITPPKQDVCKNGMAQALVSNAVGTGTLSYQWYSNTTNSTTGGTLISGATSDTYDPPTSVLGTTYYFVEVADTFCEGKTKSAVVSVTITTCCNAGTSAPALISTTISPAPATIADLIAILSASNTPAGTIFTIHSSSEATDANKLATSTAVIPGNTYYVAFWDSSNNCYSPTSQVYIAIPNSCLPDPYAAQNTWWFGFGRGESASTHYGHVIRIDFQTGTAVLNNPPTGFLGQGDDTLGYEGHTNVTNPVTGEFLFGTDGNTIYRASDGTKATGGGIGGHFSAGQAAAVIPDPEGVLGKDFIVFGNTSNTSDQPAGLNMGKYNLENNTVLGITNLLADNATTGILEALQVVPKSNGRDYWILVISANAKVRVYEYTIAGGFNPSIISEISIPNTLDTSILGTSLSWIPQQENKIVIGMGYTVGMVDFNLNTGALANYETKVTTTNVVAGYSPVISPNGKYLYHVNSSGGLDYINLSDNTQTTIFPPNTIVGVYGIKVGPDGRLYFVNGTTDTVWYIDDANNPPTGMGSASQFLTGGKKSSLALPNNTYWSCEITVCQTGTNAPVLASTTISSLPATVTDLISVLSVSNLPANTVLTIHSGSPATDSNQLASSTAIVAGSTYYVAFWDEFYGCYSPTTEISIPIVNHCVTGDCNENAFLNTSDPNTLEYDNLISGFHSSIAKQDDGNYLIWGQGAKPNPTTLGESLYEPTTITPANGFNYTGNILKATLGTRGATNLGSDQYAILTTDGLYIWGGGDPLASRKDGMVHRSVKDSQTFDKITNANITNAEPATGLPIGVNPTDVKMMFGSYATLAIVTCTGDAYILSHAGNKNGDGSTDIAANQNIWHRVMIDAATPLNGVVAMRGTNGAMVALTYGGDLYTWGTDTYLGNSTAKANRLYATKMDLPLGVTPKMIGMTKASGGTGGVTLNSYYLLSTTGDLYSLGDNSKKQLGTFDIVEQTSWVNVKSTNSSTNMTDIVWISPNEHDAAGHAVVTALTSDGKLWGWGSNHSNMLGTGSGNTDPIYMFGGLSLDEKILAIETGGHINTLFKDCDFKLGYIGHNINGSYAMPDGTTSTVFKFDGARLSNLCAIYTPPYPELKDLKTCAGNTVDLANALLSTTPAGYTLEWWTTSNRVLGTQVVNTAAVSAGTYYAFYISDTNECTSITGESIVVSYYTSADPEYPTCICFNDPNMTGTSQETKMGITLLKRAGAEDADNWPMVRTGGHLALESNTQGFVITRIAKADLGNITSPQEGMMVYDTTEKCLKLYSNGVWSCFNTPTCP